MVLDYSTKFYMSAASLSKITKTQVVFHVDSEELIHCLQGLHLLTKINLKKNGYVSQGLQKLVNFLLIIRDSFALEYMWTASSLQNSFAQ